MISSSVGTYILEANALVMNVQGFQSIYYNDKKDGKLLFSKYSQAKSNLFWFVKKDEKQVNGSTTHPATTRSSNIPLHHEFQGRETGKQYQPADRPPRGI